MITDALLNVVFGLLDLITGLLPTFTAPFVYGGSVAQDAAQTLAGYLIYLNGWVDLPLLMTVTTALGAAYAAAAGVFGILWLYRHMPGKGT